MNPVSSLLAIKLHTRRICNIKKKGVRPSLETPGGCFSHESSHSSRRKHHRPQQQHTPTASQNRISTAKQTTNKQEGTRTYYSVFLFGPTTTTTKNDHRSLLHMLQNRKIIVVPFIIRAFYLLDRLRCVVRRVSHHQNVVFIVIHYVLNNVPVLPKVNRQVWIAVASTSIIAASAYPVFAKNERAGHDLFSSEKPEAVSVFLLLLSGSWFVALLGVAADIFIWNLSPCSFNHKTSVALVPVLF